jgi:hypothetical protein
MLRGELAFVLAKAVEILPGLRQGLTREERESCRRRRRKADRDLSSGTGRLIPPSPDYTPRCDGRVALPSSSCFLLPSP